MHSVIAEATPKCFSFVGSKSYAGRIIAGLALLAIMDVAVHTFDEIVIMPAIVAKLPIIQHCTFSAKRIWAYSIGTCVGQSFRTRVRGRNQLEALPIPSPLCSVVAPWPVADPGIWV
jgi:hypothetical protein